MGHGVTLSALLIYFLVKKLVEKISFKFKYPYSDLGKFSMKTRVGPYQRNMHHICILHFSTASKTAK